MRLLRHIRRSTAAASPGFTLLELAVAVLILATATLAALRAADQSRLAIGGAVPRLAAGVAARNRIEELALYGLRGAVLPGEVTQAGQTLQLETVTEITAGGFAKVTVTAKSGGGRGPGAQLSGYLPTFLPGAP